MAGKEKYLLTVDNKVDYNHICMSVDIEEVDEAGGAFETISNITGIANKSLISILDRDNKKQTLVIEIAEGADLTKASHIKKLSGKDKVDNMFDK